MEQAGFFRKLQEHLVKRKKELVWTQVAIFFYMIIIDKIGVKETISNFLIVYLVIPILLTAVYKIIEKKKAGSNSR